MPHRRRKTSSGIKKGLSHDVAPPMKPLPRSGYKRALAKRFLKKTLYPATLPLNFVKRSASTLYKRTPPQIVRWDLLGVLLCYLWGLLHATRLPRRARLLLFKVWVYLFQVDLEEMEGSLESYPTLCEFFTRPLKPGTRTIASHGLVSPVDGKVITCGEVTADRVEQVKGVNYSISDFLGEEWTSLCVHPNTTLQYCVLYLAPGDYHRFHSPEDIRISKSRHFPGTLFPISPYFTRFIPNLLALNERLIMKGLWREGFFSLTAVGAYNVGSISLSFDETIRTNHLFRDYKNPNLRYFSYGGVGSHAYEKDYPAIAFARGEEVGKFNLGSTVVLIFEAPRYRWDVGPGDRVRMGQALGEVLPS